MDDKTKGIVATIAAVVLCGCPGLFLCFFGATSLFASAAPGAEIDVFGSSSPAAGATMGFVFLCLSLIFMAIPVVVGFLMFRKKPNVLAEDVPPAS
jgi:hypothetical protein